MDNAVEAAQYSPSAEEIAEAVIGRPDLHKPNEALARISVALLSSRSEVERMREALKPFADIADWYHDSEYDNHEIWVDAHERGTRVTLGMCKAARAALSPQPPKGDAT